jgi:hypothetical protein
MTTQEEEYLKFIGGANPDLNKKIVEEHKRWLEHKQRSTTSQGVQLVRTLAVLEKNFNCLDPIDRADVLITFDGEMYFAAFVDSDSEMNDVGPLGRGKTIYEALTDLAHELEDIDNATQIHD